MNVLESEGAELGRTEYFEFLMSIISDDSKHSKIAKDYAAMELGHKYVPEGAISGWKNDSVITPDDTIKFIKSRSPEELNLWIGERPKVLYRSDTDSHSLVISNNNHPLYSFNGVNQIPVSKILTAMRLEVLKQDRILKFDRVNLVKIDNSEKWIAVGVYVDGSKERRLIAMLDENLFSLDQKL